MSTGCPVVCPRVNCGKSGNQVHLLRRSVGTLKVGFDVSRLSYHVPPAQIESIILMVIMIKCGALSVLFNG